jgi:uncharacterized damage-inducible protein DinB
MGMKKVALCLALLAAVLAAPRARAGETVSGFRGDFLSQIAAVEKQILDLEGAVPQEKFSWRPGEGVRSIGEVYSHIAFGNYIILKLAGFEPPAEVNFVPDLKKWDTQTSNKEKIAGMIRRSFEHVNAVAMKTSDADLEKKVNIFGTEMTLRGAFMVLLSHTHEHLGQSIAYARSNAVVPPWTAEQQKAEQNAKK